MQQKPTVTLQQADCLLFLKSLPDNSVDLIVTDPPYYRFLNVGWDRQWASQKQYLHWFGRVLAQYQRVLKPNGSLYVFASHRLACHIECLVEQHFNKLNHIVWRKHSGPHNKACKSQLRSYFSQTERIIFAEQCNSEKAWQNQLNRLKGDVFKPLRDYLLQEVKKAGVTRQQIHKACGNQMLGAGISKSQWQLPSERDYRILQQLLNNQLNKDYAAVKHEFTLLNRSYLSLKQQHQQLRRPFAVTKEVPFTDVWDFKPTPARKGRHPCEKPLPLIEHIITTSSRPGETVLDTFTGSGSTAVAAFNTGRNFIGCELGEEEYQQAKERIKNLTD